MKNLNLQQLKLGTFVSALSLSALMACGKGGLRGIVQDVKLETRTDPTTQDLFADLSSIVSVGNLIFPAISIPILDPNNPLEQYGTVSLVRTVDQKNALVVSANLTEISKSQLSMDRTLPNGTPVPIYGSTDMIVLPIERAGRLYLDLSQNRKLLGVAIAIKEFQNIGQYAPGLNLFFDIPESNGIKGVAGVFTGQGPNQNGIALFLDVTEALDRALPTTSQFRIASAVIDDSTMKMMSARGDQVQDWVFVTSESAQKSSRGRKVLSGLYELSRKKKVLQVAR
jgi:hypothetical protein